VWNVSGPTASRRHSQLSRARSRRRRFLRGRRGRQALRDEPCGSRPPPDAVEMRVCLSGAVRRAERALPSGSADHADRAEELDPKVVYGNARDAVTGGREKPEGWKCWSSHADLLTESALIGAAGPLPRTPVTLDRLGDARGKSTGATRRPVSGYPTDFTIGSRKPLAECGKLPGKARQRRISRRACAIGS
jgi:hypothetical protein